MSELNTKMPAKTEALHACMENLRLWFGREDGSIDYARVSRVELLVLARLWIWQRVDGCLGCDWFLDERASAYAQQADQAHAALTMIRQALGEMPLDGKDLDSLYGGVIEHYEKTVTPEYALAWRITEEKATPEEMQAYEQSQHHRDKFGFPVRRYPGLPA